MGIPRLATKVDRRALLVSLRVDDDIRAARLVRDEHLVGFGCVREAVRKTDATDARDDFERPVIDDRDLMRAGRRDVHLVVRWNSPHSRSARQTHDFGEDLPPIRVEDDRASGVHVVHVDAAGRGVEALIIEPVWRPG